MSTKVRFAPSPTGYLHIGNTRTLMFNALFALKNDGEYILRLDDTDQARSKEEYAEAIIKDHQWFGIDIARIEKQSERLEHYHKIAEDLKRQGLLYPCYETPEELTYKRKRQAARGLPPIYDRAALNLTEEEKQAFESEGRTPHWRFKLKGKQVTWQDLCRGEQTIDTSSQSDPVLIRKDGSYLYTLPSIIDDIDFEISHVIRGEDHVSNTGTQIEIFEALGAKAPIFGHHNLLMSADGEGLSKRKGALSLKSLREHGYEAMAVAALAALTGTSHAVEVRKDLKSLGKDFDLKSVSRSSARFDPKDLDGLNAKLLHEKAYEEVKPQLAAMKITISEALWSAIRTNVTTFKDIQQWVDMIEGKIEPVIHDEDKDFITQALKYIPQEPWNEKTWSEWIKQLKENTDRKGKKLFMPLRQAITGLDYGPEIGALLPLMGYSMVVSRLSSS